MRLHRSAALALAVALGAAASAPRRARASITIFDRLLGFTRSMRPYLDDGKASEKPRQLRINGVSMLVASGHSDDPPAAVRAWYGSIYRAEGTFDRLAKEAEKRGKPLDAATLNQMQFGDDDEGGLVALDFGDKLAPLALAKRLVAFAASGDLAPVAAVRFVYVKRAPAGGTQYLTMWSTEHFSLFDLVPNGRSDAPGEDLEDVPRVPGTVRLLSVAERGMPQRLVVYAGAGASVEGAELFYQMRMRTLGWTAHDGEAPAGRRRALRYERAGRSVLVSLSSSRDGQRLLVSVMETK